MSIVKADAFLFVQIRTDTGIIGTGESGAWGFLTASAEAVLSFRTYLIGQDPLRIEHHWQYMYRCFHFRGAAVMGAISAIDIALWDIAGQYYHAPICQLLGGTCRDKVRAYYHVSGATTQALLESCQKGVASGYTALGHLSPFLDEPRSKPYYESCAAMLANSTDRVAQIRELVGSDVDLCLELHRRLTPDEAVSFSRRVEEYEPMFLEDPTTPDNFDAMAYIASKSRIPIATGERIHTIQEFEMLFARRAMAYARTSVCLCGGITGAKKIANIAEAHGIKIVPHNPYSPISSAACLHLSAAVENFAILELPDHNGISATQRYTSADTPIENGFCQADMVTWTPVCENGFVQLPTGSGLGAGLVENISERFPFHRRRIVTRLHMDGSVVDQ